MILPILTYGAAELERVSASVDKFDDELRELASNMLETMYAAPGIGLAAPQVGLNIRLIVLDVLAGEQGGNQIVLANPEIHDPQGSQRGEEGCLSIPGITAMVERPQQVRVTGQDLQGEAVELKTKDLLARILCHEVDHLDGILYLDRLSMIKRDLMKRKIRRMIRAGEWS